MKHISFAELSEILPLVLKDPPGPEAQYALAPVGRPRGKVEDMESARQSAVMALFYPQGTEAALVLIQRIDDGGVHAGQMALPGGKREASDPDFKTTALRETREEIGLPEDQIEVAGALSPLFVPPSNFVIYPYTGLCHHQPRFLPQPSEVARIHSVALEELLDIRSLRQETVQVRQGHLRVPAFHLGGQVVWGATAMILNELRQALLQQ